MALLLFPQLLLPCNTVQAVEDAATVAAALAGCHDRPTAAVPARDTCSTASQRQSVKIEEQDIQGEQSSMWAMSCLIPRLQNNCSFRAIGHDTNLASLISFGCQPDKGRYWFTGWLGSGSSANMNHKPAPSNTLRFMGIAPGRGRCMGASSYGCGLTLPSPRVWPTTCARPRASSRPPPVAALPAPCHIGRHAHLIK